MTHPSKLTGKRVMVTGASGFLGAHMVKRLLSEGAAVDAVVKAAVEPSSPIHDLGRRVTSHQVDLTDRTAVGRLVERAAPELVIHCAALTHVGQSFDRVDQNIRTNIGGTVNLLHALDGRYQRFVYVGSSDVYGDVPTPFREDGPVSPVSPYAVSKYAAERFCRMYHQAYGWPIVCLRPFNAFGPYQTIDRIIPSLILSALAGKDLDMTEGRQTREFVYVDDLVEAFVRALWTPGIEGEVINVSGGQEVSIRELAVTVLTLLGNPVQPLFGALDYRPNEIWRMYGDTAKVQALLGWTPTTSLVDGLSTTIEWCRTHH